MEPEKNENKKNSEQQYCKVPQPILLFWINKILATTVGETISDSFSDGMSLGLGITAAIMFPILALLIFAQFKFKQYIAFIYWFTVVFMSIGGTIFTDGLHDDLGLELWIEVIIFFVLMSVTFFAWYKVEQTLNIHSIYTLRRECFYWLAILFTFSLGTAVGDLISESAGIGYGATFGLFAGTIAFIFILWKFKILPDVLGFWLAYIMTRPLGASLGDLLSSDTSEQGAGIGAEITSAIFSAIIIGICIYLTISKKDVIDPSVNCSDKIKGTLNNTPPTYDQALNSKQIQKPIALELQDDHQLHVNP